MRLRQLHRRHANFTLERSAKMSLADAELVSEARDAAACYAALVRRAASSSRETLR